MKKVLRILFVLIALVLIALISIPFLMKDRIQGIVQEELNKRINAEVSFEDVSLSLIRNFPNASLGISQLQVLNKAPFQGDTLVAVDEFVAVVDLMSIMGGNDIQIKKIKLDRPMLHIQVNENGQSSYDIALEESTALDTSAATSTTAFKFGLQSYEIVGGNIRYEDETLPMQARIVGLNHTGSGDFTQEIVDLTTHTDVQQATVVFDGISYLNQTQIDADVDMKVNYANDLLVTLSNNRIQANELVVVADGDVGMKGEDILVNMGFKAPETAFKSLFSMVPGVYTQEFANLKADGQFRLEGYAKGIYNDSTLPAFGLDLQVMDGLVKYPDLPAPLSDIQVDVHIEEPDGSLEALRVDLKRLHMQLEDNPIEVRAITVGLDRIEVDVFADVKLDLEKISRVVPVEGTKLKGLFTLKGTAKGTYDEAANLFPKANAKMEMKDGYVQQAEYPAEITNLHFEAMLEDADADLTHARFEMPDFSFLLDGEPIAGSLVVTDFADPAYEARLKGVVDLDKLTKIYPLDSMEVSGKIIVEDFQTRGRMSDVEAENYTKLASSGKVKIENLRYNNPELLQPVTIKNGSGTFTPDKLQIAPSSGTLGSSDYEVSGYFSNYMAYALTENAPLKGELNFRSRKFDLNEWMEEESTVPAEGSGEAIETSAVVPVPAGITMAIDATIDEVLYDTHKLSNMTGRLLIADEAVSMSQVNFQTLGAAIAMNGKYDTKVPGKPAFDFGMDIKGIGLKEAYKNFSTVQALAPIARLLTGDADLEFSVKGLLGDDLMSILDGISGAGVFNMDEGGLKLPKSLSKVGSLTQLDAFKGQSATLNKVAGQFTIENGFVAVKPFDVKLKDVVLTVSGRQSITGQLDYDLALDMPSGTVGNLAQGALTKLTGNAVGVGDRINLDLKLTGTSEDPKVRPVGGGSTGAVKDQVTAGVKGAIEDKTGVNLNKEALQQQAEATRKRVEDSLRREAEIRKQQIEDSLRSVAEKKAKEAAEKAKKELEEKAGKEAKDKAKEGLDKLKDKIKFPGKRN
ncbi:MAG: AsmA-like C-terminal region-containing protein [Bacteroidota bacterium]